MNAEGLFFQPTDLTKHIRLIHLPPVTQLGISDYQNRGEKNKSQRRASVAAAGVEAAPLSSALLVAALSVICFDIISGISRHFFN